MNWFFIALIAPFLWAIVNISDQYLVTNYSTGIRGSGGLVLFSSLIGIFLSFIIAIFVRGVFHIPIIDILLLILTGGISIAWIILYLYTLEIEDVSVVIPWFSTIPIFGYVLSYIILGETLTVKQLLGSIIILFGVIIISIDFSGQKRKFKLRPALYILIASFLVAVSGIIFKYVTLGNRFWISCFWEYASLGICGTIVYVFVPKYRHEFNLMNKKGGYRIFALNTISETLTIIGNLLTNYAILLAPVAMVYLIESLQPAIVLFMVLFATRFFPKIIKENISRRLLIQKFIAIIIVFIGSIVLFN